MFDRVTKPEADRRRELMPREARGSRLLPPHPKHEFHLAERDSLVQGATDLDGDLNFITDVVLEVSWEAYRVRGRLLVLGTLCILLGGVGLFSLASDLPGWVRDVPVLTTLLLPLALAYYVALSIASAAGWPADVDRASRNQSAG